MRNLFKNYRNQDTNLRPIDEIFMILFLAIAIVLVFFIGFDIQQRQQLNSLAQDQAEFRVYVNKYNEALYKKVIERKVSDMLKANEL